MLLHLREQLRDILERKQINIVRIMIRQWCTNVMRSKVEPMKEVARLIRNHLEGIIAWAQTRQTNGFLEALNGLFQAAKHKPAATDDSPPSARSFFSSPANST